jgi:hypothetical protein
MPKPNKIYILTEGAYSDFTILGVAEDMETATFLVNKWGGEIEIREYYLNTKEDSKFINGKTLYEVTMWKNGNSKVEKDKNQVADAYTDPKFYFWGGMRSGGVEVIMELDCWANDEKHAVKIANDKRASLIASGEWDSHVKDLEKEQREYFESRQQHGNCSHTNVNEVMAYRGNELHKVYTCKYCHKILKEEKIE